jgi:hypothetical protein
LNRTLGVETTDGLIGPATYGLGGPAQINDETPICSSYSFYIYFYFFDTFELAFDL